jgi:hypothetical protein
MKINAFRLPVGTTAGEDSTTMNLKGMEWEGVEWIHLAQDMVSGGLLPTPYGTIRFH